MAYRRRHGQEVSKLSSSNDEIRSSYPPTTTTTITPTPPPDESSSSSSSASSLAAKAIRASSAYRDSALSSAYGQSALSSPRQRGDSNPNPNPSGSSSLSSAEKLNSFEYTSIKGLNEPKHGFWGTLARKAKAILEDDNAAQHIESPKGTRMQMPASEHVESPRKTKMQMPSAEHIESPRRTRMQMPDIATRGQRRGHNVLSEGHQKSDNPSLQKRLDAITSSLTYIGGTIGNVLEEGITIVENRTADIIQETRKLQLRRKGSGKNVQIQGSNANVSSPQASMPAPAQPRMQTPAQPRAQADLDIQLKASRDVAMAMAAKAKLLLRELKTVKADLAFAKERCAQLEEENRILRDSQVKGDNPEDDDLIRLQLETLLAEKARLAQENSVFARENRFLREIVEYHQLTMQDVVYLDEGNEEVHEVFPIKVPSATDLQSLSTSSPTSPAGPHVVNLQVAQDVSALPVISTEFMKSSQSVTKPNSYIHIPVEDSQKRC